MLNAGPNLPAHSWLIQAAFLADQIPGIMFDFGKILFT